MVLNHTDRVRANTAAEVNRRVDEQIERNIRHYSGQTIRDKLGRHLPPYSGPR